MRPTNSTTVPRPDLGAIAYQYAVEASQKRFIGARVLPWAPVPKQSADYPVLPSEAFLKLPDTARNADGTYNRDGWKFENDNYATVEYGKESELEDSEVTKWEGFYTALDLEEPTVQRNVDILLRGHEKRVADAVFNTTNLTSNAVGSGGWLSAGSEPIEDVQTGWGVIQDATGLEPNALVMSRAMFFALLRHTQIQDVMQYTNPVERFGWEAAKTLLGEVFNVEKVLVGSSVYDSAKKGKSTSTSAIWSNHYALLARISEGGINLKEPTLGRSFLWTGDAPNQIETETYREEGPGKPYTGAGPIWWRSSPTRALVI